MKPSPIRRRPFHWLLVLALTGRSLAAPGDLDTSFGTGGSVTTSFAAGDDLAYAVAVQADGKILVAGGSSEGDYAVWRVLANGTPDPNFGGGGKFVHSFGQLELARGVAEVSGGKILVGGSGVVDGASRDFAAMRLLPGGGLDPDYGTGGLVTTDISGGFNEHVHCMAVDSGGRAILAGYHRGNFALVRYTATGALDPSFGTGGKVFSSTMGPDQQANAIALQSDGKIIIAGHSLTGSNTDFVVARYLENGTPDPDFGGGGKTITPVGLGNISDVANAVAILPGGKILVAGTTNNDYVVLRYTAAGVLDTDFGSGGGFITGFTGATDAGYGLAVQNDGKILVAGTSHINARDYFGMFRFTPEGGLDGSFINGGGTLTPITTGSDSARAIALQSDGKILLAGYGGALDDKDFAVARFESAVSLTLPAWRQFHFGTTANSGNAANDFDFDKDGLVNLLEYAFGQDPTKASSRTVPSGEVIGGNFVSTFTAPSGTTGITYAAEWSPTMAAGTWTPLTDTGNGSVHTFSVPMSGRTKLYVRWKVTAL